MADSQRDEQAAEKLNMSLDALIRKRSRGEDGQDPAYGQERGSFQRRGSQGRGLRARGRESGRGDFGRNPAFAQSGGRGGGGRFGRNPDFTSSGLIMPSFDCFPPGSYPIGPPIPVDPAMLGSMPFGYPVPGMPPPEGGLPMPMRMSNGPDGNLFSGGFGMPMPPQMPGERNGVRGQAPPPAEPKPTAPAAVPQARLDEGTGEVTVTFKGKTIVKVSRSGAITLDSGGVRGPAVFMALNAVLNTVDISVTRPKKDDEWSISDGRSLTRFTDGVVLHGRGAPSAQRGPKILAAFGGADPSAAAAATAASNAAAAAAGIVLPGRGSAEKRPDSQAHASHGQEHGHRSAADGRPQTNGRAPRGNDAHQQDASNKSTGDPELDRIRRLKAKGRYRPY